MPLWRTKSNHSQAESDSATADPKNDPVASASQAASDAWLAGHLHHLTEEQEGKLTEFKKFCEKEGYYKPGVEGEKPSHDDATLLYVRLLTFHSVVLFSHNGHNSRHWGLPGS